jgi:hypothetical protein
MSESGGIDSIFGGRSMPKPCSLDLRERVLDAVALHPFDSRAGAHLEAFSCLAARRTRFAGTKPEV